VLERMGTWKPAAARAEEGSSHMVAEAVPQWTGKGVHGPSLSLSVLWGSQCGSHVQNSMGTIGVC
jgi:ribosomal protein S16